MTTEQSKEKLDLADAQFIGWHFGRREPSILQMVESMGLTNDEWNLWKMRYPNSYLTTHEKKEIDYYFKNKL